MAGNLPSTNKKGEFVKPDGEFRQWVTADGSSGFKAERDRYHLYMSYACPFASRCLVGRKLKGLEDIIPITSVDYIRLGENGWSFTDKRPKCSLDPISNAKYLKDIYLKVNPNYTGRITVPVLWDKKTGTIVSNESAEILRMFNSAFNEFCATDEQRNIDLYPEELREKIDGVNEWVTPNISNGVYRAGFATTQEAYNEGVKGLFENLDKVEEILSKNRFLTGDRFTEADVRLFTTLVRFDTVYVGHFKCNKKRIVDYPNMWGYLKEIYQMKGISDTVDQDHIQQHYQVSHRHLNPNGIVAIGPDLDFNAPHGRENLVAN
ncbi:glutathionyl-hydroquinone reductase YqjG-like [Anneissia japonica]|uniref:glutathionyl-hydroquinone reductase YqjG-like n=1 Tax=Anneissia japonica TaxID=1529436 RepID=UPI00142553B8|nr:glutathionyl-hydroquinone reductase YqjG-like [Anneissia japonica]